MRLYGKRFARNFIQKETKAVQETRDAILWDIQESTHTCRVKIQGSGTLIIAHFPRNWKSTPYWLKRGNAVRILHRGGNRGYVEVTGEGRAIPTPVSGESLPDAETLPDTIISGCGMTAMDTELGVIIASGTYRIDGNIYTLSVNDQITLFDSEAYVLYDSEDYEYFQPDDGTIHKYLDTAPSVGSFRYDAFCVGVDGVIDYLKGTASSTPEKPSIPASHVLLGDYILVVGGATVIESKDIGKIWTEPYAVILEIDIESSGSTYNMPFVPGSPAPNTVEADIVVTIKDQYNNNYSASCTSTMTKELGDGPIYSSDSGWQASEVSQVFTTTTTFKWERDQTDIDNVPMVFTLEGTIDGQLLTSVGIIIPEEEV